MSVDPAIEPLVFSSGTPTRIMVANVEWGLTGVNADMQVLVRGLNHTCGSNRLEVRTFLGNVATNSIAFTVAVI